VRIGGAEGRPRSPGAATLPLRHLSVSLHRPERDPVLRLPLRATLAQGGEPPLAAPELVGLTEAARLQPSFLAAAAFERATLVLAEAALAGREDDLSVTNARVLLGAVVPRGCPD
jgi:hypothetical protein